MSTVYHFIYKTTHINGKYYIGRHSTMSLNDKYFGSGVWIKSIKNKSELSREILEYSDNYEDLIVLEDKYLAEHHGQHNCMNFNKNSSASPFNKRRKHTPEAIAKKKQTMANPVLRNKISISVSKLHKDPNGPYGKEWAEKRLHQKKRIIISPGGEIFHIQKDFKEFCRYWDLSYQSMNSVARCDTTHHKGWRVVYTH